MDATSSTLNAKQRRKLLREQQRKQTEGTAEHDVTQEAPAPVKEEAAAKPEPVKEEAVTQSKPVKTEAQDGGAQLNAKERRRLARLEKQVAEESKEEAAAAATTTTATATATATDDDGETLNAQQRRLLKRQAKRKAEGVEEFKPPVKKQKKAKKQKTDEDGKPAKSIHLTLFVGQLPFRATEESIRKHFAEAGDIKLRMLTDKKTKKFKGTAFIEVKDSKALGAALSRHHTLLQGRRINVELTAGGGGNKSENRRNKIDTMRKKQSDVQVEKTKALIQKHIDGPEYKLQKDDVDERMIDFLSWFDYETAKKALEEYNRCVSDRVNNRKAFFMGILKRFRQTDGVE